MEHLLKRAIAGLPELIHPTRRKLRDSVVFFGAATTTYVRGSPSHPGRNSGRPSGSPHVGRKGTRGQHPPVPLSGFMRKQRPDNRGAAVCVDCESNKEKVSQRLPFTSAPCPGRPEEQPQRRAAVLEVARRYLGIQIEAPSGGPSVARPDLPVVQRRADQWLAAGTSARPWRSLRPDGSAGSPRPAPG
jgi:hypothetical protein